MNYKFEYSVPHTNSEPQPEQP